MSQELLSCPFCGGAAMERHALFVSDGCTDSIVHANPTPCGLTHFSIGATDHGVSTRTAWNTRSPSPVAVGAEEIARIIDPQSWKLFDEESRPRPKNPEVLYWKEYYRLGLRRSLETVTAILALLNPSPTGEKP